MKSIFILLCLATPSMMNQDSFNSIQKYDQLSLRRPLGFRFYLSLKGAFLTWIRWIVFIVGSLVLVRDSLSFAIMILCFSLLFAQPILSIYNNKFVIPSTIAVVAIALFVDSGYLSYFCISLNTIFIWQCFFYSKLTTYQTPNSLTLVSLMNLRSIILISILIGVVGYIVITFIAAKFNLSKTLISIFPLLYISVFLERNFIDKSRILKSFKTRFDIARLRYKYPTLHLYSYSQQLILTSIFFITIVLLILYSIFDIRIIQSINIILLLLVQVLTNIDIVTHHTLTCQSVVYKNPLLRVLISAFSSLPIFYYSIWLATGIPILILIDVIVGFISILVILFLFNRQNTFY